MITETLMGPGSFDIGLKAAIPTAILHGSLDLDVASFGHIVVTTVRMTDRPLTATGIKAVSRYTGVYRRQEGPQLLSLHGAGLTVWLSDEDGKDSYADVEVADFAGDTHYSNAITLGGLIPSALTSGTITDIVVGTGLSDLNPASKNRKEVLDKVAAFFGGEYRVNPDFTFDAGPAATLWSSNTTPTAILLSRALHVDGGRDINVKGMVATITPDIDVEDLTTYLVIVDSDGIAVGRAGGNHATLKDGKGNALRLRRVEQSNETQPAAGNAAAQAQLNRFLLPRQQLKVEISDVHDVGLDFEPGDAVWMFAPDAGVVDAANQVTYRGQSLSPAKLRVQEMTWPVVPGMGVYFLPPTAAQTPVDLTEYVEFEDGPTSVSVGAPSRRIPFVRGLPAPGVGVA